MIYRAQLNMKASKWDHRKIIIPKSHSYYIPEVLSEDKEFKYFCNNTFVEMMKAENR